MLRHLAVFRGSCTPAAIAAVCGTADSHHTTLDQIQALVDASLLQSPAAEDADGRLRLLETVHAYAREQLEAAGEVLEAGRRHALFFLQLAEQAEPHLKSGRREAWLTRLDAELDNLRAALAWCCANPDGVALGLRMAWALDMYWHFRDHWREADDWLVRLLAVAGPAVSPALHARGACVSGRIAVFLREYIPAHERLHTSLTLAELADDRVCHAYALTWQARMASGEGLRQQAHDLAAEAAARFRIIGDTWGLALSLWYLASPAVSLGDAAGAFAALEESLHKFRSLADDWGMGLVYEELARLLRGRGDHAAARRAAAQALTVRRRAGVKFAIASSLVGLARACVACADDNAGATAFDEAIGIFRELGLDAELMAPLRQRAYLALRGGEAGTAVILLQECLRLAVGRNNQSSAGLALAGLAAAAAVLGDRDVAGQIAAAARALVDRVGFANYPGERHDYERHLAAAGAPPPGIAGTSVSSDVPLALNSAADLALSLLPPPSPVPGSTDQSALHGGPARQVLPDGISPREAEVLRLIATGCSNREIAEALVLSVRTVEKHIARLYDKIDARGRADATAYAIRHALT